MNEVGKEEREEGNGREGDPETQHAGCYGKDE
jgi:hypothetical protein